MSSPGEEWLRANAKEYERQMRETESTMTPDQRLILIGGYISSALYLSGCFVAGIWLHYDPVWKLALGSEGFACACYAAQLLPITPESRKEFALWPFIASWVFGALAGLILLFGA
jgi:hypothetical protein